jgi:alpha/beta superfamily hydrolase
VSPSPPVAEPVKFEGRAGVLEAVAETPFAAATEAFMVICHPHPLHRGTMTNKVVTTLARSAHEVSVPTLRFNFRGVGASAGSFDEGRGETDDALAAIAWGRQRWPAATLWLAGFSFGGFVALRASAAPDAGSVGKLVTVAPALAKNFGTVRDIRVPGCPWLIVQGDADDVVDASVVTQWSNELQPPPRLVTLAGVGHFFHGKLGALQQQVVAFLREH